MSTKEQNVEIQRQSIIESCGLFANIKFYVDVSTGRNSKRPNLIKMIDELKSSDSVVVTDISRLTRCVEDGEQLYELFEILNISFIVLDQKEKLMGNKDLFMKLIADSQREAINIGQRVSLCMQQRIAAGTLRSRPPFGFKFVGKDKDFEPVPEQLEAIEKILEWRQQGIKTHRIAIMLNEAGYGSTLDLNKPHPTDKPKKFVSQQVKRILALTPETLEKRIKTHHRPNVNGRPVVPATNFEPTATRNTRTRNPRSSPRAQATQ